MRWFICAAGKSGMNKVFSMFASGDFDVVREFRPVAGCSVGVLPPYDLPVQAAPLPAFLLTLANANLLMVAGAVLSLEQRYGRGSCVFFIARILGGMLQKKLTSKAGSHRRYLFEKYGRNTILICRLLPFVSFDIVSYVMDLLHVF